VVVEYATRSTATLAEAVARSGPVSADVTRIASMDSSEPYSPT
jgi:hypothetical protein